jgi:small ligand-binding sensory domain FIST
MMPFPLAHATHPQWAVAAALVLAQLRAQLGARQSMQSSGAPGQAGPAEVEVPSLGLLYFTDHFSAHAQDMLDHFMAELPEVTDWAGTVGVGIAATGVEYIDEPALAVMLLDLPADQYRVFSGVAPLPVALTDATHSGFVATTALVHADPTTPDLPDLIAELAQRTAAGSVFGGVSSGRQGGVQLAHSSRGALRGQGSSTGVFRGGLSGVAFGQGVAMVCRVTQGCTPVAIERTITHADGHLVLTLDDQPALGVLLADLGVTLDEPQAAMARLRSTLVGLSPGTQGRPGVVAQAAVGPAGQSDPLELGFSGLSGTGGTARRRGQLGVDVRVRHVIGLDPAREGVAVADVVAVGEHWVSCVRNPEAARADLMRMCAELREDLETPDAATPPRRMVGAVYISCAGRGGPHFGHPHAELQWVRRALGDVPLIGWFAGGEVAGRQLYGYTGVLTVFTAPV